MPRHDRTKTPPEKRRAAKGSIIGRMPTGRHTAESAVDLEVLKAHWNTGDVETIRKALRQCAEHLQRGGT